MSGFRGASAVFWVLVAGTAGSPGGLAAGLEVRPGAAHFEISNDGCRTVLSADWTDLAAQLCGGRTPRAGGAEDCRLTAGDREFEPGLLTLEIGKGGSSGFPGITQVGAVATSLHLAGTSVETDCGSWTWALELEPLARQPVSKIQLLPVAEDPFSGVTSGVLEIAAALRFRQDDSGEEVTVPWPLALDFVVRWSLERPPGPGETDLQFLQDAAGSPTSACLGELARCGRMSLRRVPRTADGKESQ